MFSIRIIKKGGKPKTQGRVSISELGLFGGTYNLHHTGEGRWECSSNKQKAMVFIDGKNYGIHESGSTIDEGGLLVFKVPANLFGTFLFLKIFYLLDFF